MEKRLLNKLQDIMILKIDENYHILDSYTKYEYLKKGSNLKDYFSSLQIKDIFSLKKDEKTILKTGKKVFKGYMEKENGSYFLYLHDISKFDKMEAKLKQSLENLTSKKQELQAIFDLAANGISILDRNGMFLYANKFFQDMMGYTMEELYKESCISLSSPEYAKPSKTAVEKAVKYGSIERFRKICLTKSGKPINASMSLSYIKSTDEIVMITSDITEDIKYQDELKRRVEQEVSIRTQQHEIMCHQSRLAAMGEMIDSIAHQWRQPLNSLGIIVQGLKHLSRQQNFDQKLLQEIETEIMEKITFMSQTIDDFSTFFRTSKQKENFDLSKSIKDAVRLIDIQLKSKKISINIKEHGTNELNVYGYVNEFRQVILNMIHNAMMAISTINNKNGYINIDIKHSNNNIDIIITDNGGGIEDENLEKIFDPYFTTKNNGSGIGLYMSKVIIEHHMEGSLRVKNYNNGAEFTISLKQTGKK